MASDVRPTPRLGMAARLAVVLAFAALATMGVSAALDYDAGTRRLERELAGALQDVEGRLQVSLRQPVYEFADATVSDIVRAEMAGQDVQQVLVWRGGSRDRLICGYVRRGDVLEAVGGAPPDPPATAVTVDRPLVVHGPDGDQTVGAVRVSIDTVGPKRRLLSALMTKIAQLSLSVLLVLTILYLVVNRALVTPLERLRVAMERVETVGYGDVAPQLDMTGAFAELRAIAQAFGRMLEAIGARQRAVLQSDRVRLQEEERFRTLIANVPGVVYRCDPDDNRPSAFISDGVAQLVGVEAAAFVQGAVRWRGLVSPEDLERLDAAVVRAVEARVPFEVEYRIKRADGAVRWVSDRGRAVYSGDGSAQWIDGVILDITGQRQAEEERRGLESKLIQAQKLDSIGVLAGGIAHDFNNILTPILGHAEILEMILPEADPAQEDLRTVIEAAKRGVGLTRQILAFSRRQHLQVSILDINVEVASLLKMLRRVIGEDIEIRTHLEPDLHSVEADPSQLQQVLLNLAVNARDAMPDGGVLTIETSNVDLDAPDVWSNADLQAGRYVVLSVSDTGCGMTAETSRHLFEPFFTTKELGKGTGLGLSTAHGIVKQHKGDISVHSELGRGTTFEVYLPFAEKAAEEAAEQVGAEQVGGSGRILVVEDEAHVRGLVRRVLSQFGYTVLEADSGEAALAIARDESMRIDLLLTDVVMPGMNGRQLYERLAAARPRLRVLYMSGYPALSGSLERLVESGVPFLAKPFTVRGLAEKVRELLSATPSLPAAPPVHSVTAW